MQNEERVSLPFDARETLYEAVKAMGLTPEHLSDQEERMIAARLSVLGNRPEHKPWGGDYVHGVLVGKLPAGKKFGDAIRALYQVVVFGVPEDDARAEAVEVKSIHNVYPGSLILTDSVLCANPQCNIWFIPTAHHQKYHTLACKRFHEMLKKRKGKNASLDNR